MADIKPNMGIQRKKLENACQSQKLNLGRQELRKMEIEDELSKLESNYNATLTEIANLESQIKELAKEVNNG